MKTIRLIFPFKTYRTLLGYIIMLSLFLSCDYFPVGGGPDLENAHVGTVIANFPANDALSVDRRGRIYASNFGTFTNTNGDGTTLLKVDPRAEEFVELSSDLVGPTGNAVDTGGTIYVVNNVVADFVNGSIAGEVVKITPNGTKTVLASLEGFPSGLALDRQKNAYVTNFNRPLIHKISPEGEVSVVAEDARLAGCVGIDFDDEGTVLVGNFTTGEILSVDSDGKVESITTLPTVVQGFVIGYITYYRGFIYATAAGENVIYQISRASGEARIFAGNGEAATVDGPLLEASFNFPNGITIDPRRRTLYVSEGGISGGLRAIPLY